jgi:hypothetical protein
MINLPVLRSAIRNTCHRSKFIFKFQHGLLPTQAKKSVWEYCTSDCPSCLEPDNQHHFLRCLHNTVQTWRESFLHAFRARLTALHTSHELTTIMIDVVEAWLDGEQINPCNYPRHYRAGTHRLARIFTRLLELPLGTDSRHPPQAHQRILSHHDW